MTGIANLVDHKNNSRFQTLEIISENQNSVKIQKFKWTELYTNG